MRLRDFKALSYAYGRPTVWGRLPRSPEDFQVDEWLGFEPEGEGSHAFLHIRKRGMNTQWVARRLTELAGVRPVDVVSQALKIGMRLPPNGFPLTSPEKMNRNGRR